MLFQGVSRFAAENQTLDRNFGREPDPGHAGEGTGMDNLRFRVSAIHLSPLLPFRFRFLIGC